jgi:hypothetical protein
MYIPNRSSQFENSGLTVLKNALRTYHFVKHQKKGPQLSCGLTRIHWDTADAARGSCKTHRSVNSTR